MTNSEMRSKVEEVIKKWRKLQEEVWSTERDAANIAFSQGSGEPVQSSSISDKTARGAFLLDSISEKRAWVECVTDAMKWLGEEQPDLQRLLYGHYGMDKTKGYKRNHARSFTKSYCEVYHISISEYKSRRWEGLNQIANLAAEYGLVSIRTKVRPER